MYATQRTPAELALSTQAVQSATVHAEPAIDRAPLHGCSPSRDQSSLRSSRPVSYLTVHRGPSPGQSPLTHHTPPPFSGVSQKSISRVRRIQPSIIGAQYTNRNYFTVIGPQLSTCFQ
ncbi:hypothetical protein G7K_0132-t1 [Saitoella complicata NRRL Y-17804]|uniref:Uncharacterized protein n=1 Tax=Saitoella complicata (strain BCRC 22490 / CBS 7301 / JCM 7358 / NBRC 10748 / NRRL Y-17804) TaxID=698492 RepID=A0A0E9N865_SAICN|nr:hypothetical protein G7K_0132-t1 [Saitoella complicata NRRL Y-17804]